MAGDMDKIKEYAILFDLLSVSLFGFGADWSEVCFPLFHMEHVVNSAVLMPATCFWPIGQTFDGMPHAADLTAQQIDRLQSIEWVRL